MNLKYSHSLKKIIRQFERTTTVDNAHKKNDYSCYLVEN